ncbi:hypothetical protein A5721_26920 [Mycobacterium vulneris]|nr:hypothetical protein A5721_26920 [Mycolicibacterium vulneris]
MGSPASQSMSRIGVRCSPAGEGIKAVGASIDMPQEGVICSKAAIGDKAQLRADVSVSKFEPACVKLLQDRTPRTLHRKEEILGNRVCRRFGRPLHLAIDSARLARRTEDNVIEVAHPVDFHTELRIASCRAQ